MTLAVSILASRGDQTEPGRVRLRGPVCFQEEGADSQGDNTLIIRLTDILGDVFTQTALNGLFRVVTSCCERARYRTFQTRWGGGVGVGGSKGVVALTADKSPQRRVLIEGTHSGMWWPFIFTS